MSVVKITDTYTVKKFGIDKFYSIQDYHTLDYSYLEGEEAELFEMELEGIYSSSHNDNEFDNKLDILCGQYV